LEPGDGLRGAKTTETRPPETAAGLMTPEDNMAGSSKPTPTLPLHRELGFYIYLKVTLDCQHRAQAFQKLKDWDTPSLFITCSCQTIFRTPPHTHTPKTSGCHSIHSWLNCHHSTLDSLKVDWRSQTKVLWCMVLSLSPTLVYRALSPFLEPKPTLCPPACTLI
jgi:hypothetical protein